MPSTPGQQRRRDQVEAAVRLAAPLLDLVLAVGERVSRIAGRDGDDHYAIRPAGERLQIDVRGLRSVPPSRQPEA